ncbi:MAG TPA: TonB-dependent receptor [Thermoanaerobaculia bacterium]|nr:TonB-dependent receptor [Thermoanaerobaculia bacterium]
MIARVVLIFLFAVNVHAAFAGRPLIDALRELETRGLHIIYSDDVVTRDMLVRDEPRATRPREILDELLREHSLRATKGPRGSLVIVRDERRNNAAMQTAPPLKMPITLEEIVVTPSRFTMLREEPEARQFLSREEVQRVPHLADDLYRAINRIPGTTSADVSARFNLRGGEEDEVLVLVDGAEIYDPFHIRDLYRAFSTIDAEAVGSVDVLSGGYPTEYGGRMSGVVDIDTLTPTETQHEVGISLLNTRVLSQGTFGESRGAWLFSLRRGYLKEVLALIDDAADVNPRYYDLLGKLQWTLNDRAVISGHVMASRDRLTLRDGPGTFAEAAYDDRYAWLNLRASPSETLFAQSVLSWGSIGRDRDGAFDNEFDQQQGELVDHHRSTFVSWKNDATLQLSPRQLLKFGVTAKRLRATFDVDGESVIPFVVFALGEPPREVRRSVHVQRRGNDVNAYIADRLRLSERIVVEGGLRAGTESYTPGGVHVSPRINVAWSATPRTSVRAAWGIFHQPQAIHELQVEDGVTEYARAQRSEHRVLGIEHSFKAVDARLELYDKSMTNLRPRYLNLYDRLLLFPELRADRIRIAPERGRARGAELLVRTDAALPLSAWMSYTLARVTDTIDGREVARDWDQRHAMTFSANYRRGERWNFNLAGTWHSGWPTTPIVARLDGDALITELGPRSSTRLPDYQRLDFRATRTSGRLSIFLELFNLLGHENVTRVNTFQFFESAEGNVTAEPITESVLGIVPSFGVTWRF